MAGHPKGSAPVPLLWHWEDKPHIVFECRVCKELRQSCCMLPDAALIGNDMDMRMWSDQDGVLNSGRLRCCPALLLIVARLAHACRHHCCPPRLRPQRPPGAGQTLGGNLQQAAFGGAPCIPDDMHACSSSLRDTRSVAPPQCSQVTIVRRVVATCGVRGVQARTVPVNFTYWVEVALGGLHAVRQQRTISTSKGHSSMKRARPALKGSAQLQ